MQVKVSLKLKSLFQERPDQEGSRQSNKRTHIHITAKEKITIGVQYRQVNTNKIKSSHTNVLSLLYKGIKTVGRSDCGLYTYRCTVMYTVFTTNNKT